MKKKTRGKSRRNSSGEKRKVLAILQLRKKKRYWEKRVHAGNWHEKEKSQKTKRFGQSLELVAWVIGEEMRLDTVICHHGGTAVKGGPEKG